MKDFILVWCGFLLIALFILGVLGWGICVIKLINTDFKAPYKEEIIYGIGSFTPMGAIIGWVNIKEK